MVALKRRPPGRFSFPAGERQRGAATRRREGRSRRVVPSPPYGRAGDLRVRPRRPPDLSAAVRTRPLNSPNGGFGDAVDDPCRAYAALPVPSRAAATCSRGGVLAADDHGPSRGNESEARASGPRADRSPGPRGPHGGVERAAGPSPASVRRQRCDAPCSRTSARRLAGRRPRARSALTERRRSPVTSSGHSATATRRWLRERGLRRRGRHKA